MRAFITGITGFAGGFLAEHLLHCGDEVLGCSRGGAWPSWAGGRLRETRVVPWDVGISGPPESLATILAEFKPDCVYHLAALSVPSDCGTAEPTERAIETNVRGTQRVLELAAGQTSRPRFVFVSTSHVYGKASHEQRLFAEDTPPAPQRAYGKTKLMAENTVRQTAEKQGLDTIIARAFQHTGPRQEPRLMLPEWAAQVARDAPRLRVKHLDTWVDVSDVRDVVRAYRLLAERGERGGVYNVGCGVARRTGNLVDALVRHSGAATEVVELEPGGERFDPIADLRRVQAATGWRPEIAIERTITDTLNYWREASAPAAR